jgi:5-methylcytosine-specific restriction protein A
MSKRAFRTQDSYDAEHITRDMIKGFLAERGFASIQDDRAFHGKVESQTIHAMSPYGKKIVMRVRLCWRRTNPTQTNSAAQILPNIKNNDWEGTLRHKVEHEIEQGVTHTLFIQREYDRISYAALIPHEWLKSNVMATRRKGTRGF